MFKASSTSRYRTRTFALLAACVALALAAGWTGIEDNLPGLLLAYLSATALFTALAHRWRSPANFRRLVYVALAGFVVSTILHNVFYALASVPDLPGLARAMFTGAEIAFFFAAVLLCPPAFVVGVVGAVLTFMMRRDS